MKLFFIINTYKLIIISTKKRMSSDHANIRTITKRYFSITITYLLLLHPYWIFFKCYDIGVLSRLGRCVERNYSDGNWEIVVDSCDVDPYGGTPTDGNKGQ